MKVLVLLGGDSPEREVSLRSGKAVAEAAAAAGHEVEQYDPINGYDGLDKFVGKVDCVLPIIHGVNGEDGSLQRELEKRDFKFLGSSSQVSELCFDKEAFKKALENQDIKTPKWEVVDSKSFFESPLVHKAFVLKPVRGGSSIDTFIVRNITKAAAHAKIFQKHPKMLIEHLVEVAEITVAVLDDQALPVIEIIPPEGQEFDFENKYNGATQEICPPKNISEDVQKRARELALQIHRHLGVRHLSRTDMMLDHSGELYVLELNTMPGLSDQSLYPKAAAGAGLGMPELVDTFIKLVTQ